VNNPNDRNKPPVLTFYQRLSAFIGGQNESAMSNLTKSESARLNGRTLEQLRRLRQSENEPTEPPKTGLNGEKPTLNGAT
jgi:hypothetical protein